MFLAATLIWLSSVPAVQSEDWTPKRPRDPFVFRSVLDGRARMLTIALDEEMWVTYDPAVGALHKAWKGGVHFDGAVYTTVHGPQPTIEGQVYTLGVEDEAWVATVGGQALPCLPHYKGYLLVGDVVVIQWEIEIGDGRRIRVDERPEFVRPRRYLADEAREELGLGEGRQPGLHRIFEAHEVPLDVRLALVVRTDGCVGRIAPGVERERFVDVKDAAGKVVETQILAHVPFTHDHPHNAFMLFFAPRAAGGQGVEGRASATEKH